MRFWILFPDLDSVTALAKKAEISRSTFYRHHKGLRWIMPDLEEYALADFAFQIAEQQSLSGVKVRVLFYRMLSFIAKNREEFKLILERGDERTLEKMIDSLLPRIVRSYKIPSRNRLVLIYKKEIVAVIESWILADFQESELEILNDIMYLTRSARQHLMPLNQ